MVAHIKGHYKYDVRPCELTNLTMLNKKLLESHQKVSHPKITNPCPLSSPYKIFMFTFLALPFVNANP